MRFAEVRKQSGLTQKALAKMLGVSRSSVAMWETSNQEPCCDVLCKIAEILCIPLNYIFERGPFACWDNVITHYYEVYSAIAAKLPRGFSIPSFNGDKNLVAWLDSFYYTGEFNSASLIRWFDFSVQKIIFGTCEGCSNETTNVEVLFTPEFNLLIAAYEPKPSRAVTMSEALDSFFKCLVDDTDGSSMTTSKIEKDLPDAVKLYIQLDEGDRGDVRGQMKQMLKAEKYKKFPDIQAG